MKFIDSARFMATSLSNLNDNLPEGIHKIKCKDCDCFLEYESFKDNLIKERDYSNKIDEEPENQFKNTFKFSSNINEFILSLKKLFILMSTW